MTNIEINQEHLEDAISDLEKGYVSSIIELIKIPVFRKAIKKDLRSTKTTEEKKKQLEQTLDMNKLNEAGHKESIANTEAILTEVYKLRK